MIHGKVEGWAFLVGRGRTEGYRTLLAPGFLIDDLQFGILAQRAVGVVPPDGPPKVASAVLPGGELTIVFRTLRVTERLLEAMVAGAGETSVAPDVLVTDQHGRPLDLSYGFATLATLGAGPDERDLDSAREQALASYRRFIADEASYAMEPSRAFAIRTTTPPRPRPRPEGRPAPAARGYPGPSTPRPAGSSGAGHRAGGGLPLRVDVGPAVPAVPRSAAIAVLAVLLVVMVVVFVLSQGGPDGADVAEGATIKVGTPSCKPSGAGGTQTCSITVRSTGTEDLELSDLKVGSAAGEKPARATWSVAKGCPASIRPGDDCVIEVNVRPAAGNRASASGLLTFATNVPGQPTMDVPVKVTTGAAAPK